MTATYVHDGRFIEFTPTSDTPTGAVVVQGDLVGVTTRPIPANTPGNFAVEGVFAFPKASGVGSAITKGALMFWHADVQQANPTAEGGKLLGKSSAAAGDNDASVNVRLSQ